MLKKTITENYFKKDKNFISMELRLWEKDTNERHTLWGKSTQRETNHLSASASILKIESVITFSTKKSVDPVVFTA